MMQIDYQSPTGEQQFEKMERKMRLWRAAAIGALLSCAFLIVFYCAVLAGKITL